MVAVRLIAVAAIFGGCIFDPSGDRSSVGDGPFDARPGSRIDADPLTRNDAGNPVSTFQHGVADYLGAVDTTLSEQTPTTPDGGRNILEWELQQGETAIALLRFDSIFGTGTKQVQPGAQILSASLRIRVVNDGDDGELREALTAWTEQSTWIQLPGLPGGGHFGDVVAIVPGSLGQQEVDVTSSVAAWSADPASNLGWAVVSTGDGGVDVVSSDGANGPERPQLVVEWRP